MVSFISGRASTGKTYEVYKRISKLASEKENVVLIVPEQFSFETEKAMLNLLGEAPLNYVSVLPFSRIYETIGRITGGVCGKVLTNADKHILMDRAISSVANELELWGKYAKSMHFSSQMLTSIDEFKFAGINSTDLFNAANSVKGEKLSRKLRDTGKIYEEYTMLLGTSFIDPSDYMDKLCDMLDRCDYFNDKNVFFDGFKSFSGQQFKVIDRIVSSAKTTVFTFLDDKYDKRNYSVLTNVRKTKYRINQILSSHNLHLSEDVFLENDYFNNGDLRCLEQSLFSGKFVDKEKKNSITVCEAETIYDEAEFAARNIRKIVREENASYSDFVIIARDTSTYEDALTVACKRNNVSIFIDKKTSLSNMPISMLIISAIEFTKRPTTKNIIDFYKTGITHVDDDAVNRLEEYALVWNIKAKDFDTEWDMNPLGLTERSPKDISEQLEDFNYTRRIMIEPLKRFKERFVGTPKQRSKAIFDLLNDVDAAKQLANLSESYRKEGEFEFADLLRQSYSQFMTLLDSVVRCFPDTQVSKPVFFDALKTVLSLNSVGVVPQTLDQVVFGSAERIRPARPKYVFLLGANQGIYPRIKVASGLFTGTDLSALKLSGLDVNDKAMDLAVDEQLLIYSNICCATDRVFISYSKNLPDNSVSTASRFVEQIKELNVVSVKEPQSLDVDNLPETFKSAVIERYKRINDRNGDSELIYNTIKDIDECGNTNLDRYELSFENARLTENAVRGYFEKDIHISATRLETFSKCRFMYFCKYMANADNREKAELTSMNRGTMVHYVLEKMIGKYKEKIYELSFDEISENVEQCCDEYIDSIPGYRTVENERSKYMVYTIKRTLTDVIVRIAREFEQSLFKPVGFEVEIDKDKSISVVSKIDDEHDLILRGKVDRVDKYDQNIRIVDYKTGSKEFDLSDLLEGINMQMLVYLNAIEHNGKYGTDPSAVIYMIAERRKDKNDAKPSGLIVSDESLISAMERDNRGEYIPFYNKSRPSANYISADDFAVVLDFVDQKLKSVGKDMISGDVSARPLFKGDKSSCEYCDFYSVCRVNDDAKRVASNLTKRQIIEKMKEGVNNGDGSDDTAR